MSKLRIEGSFVASVTPFNANGEIDFGAFRELIDFQRRNGTVAMLFMGSTGEPSLLPPVEKKRLVVETAKMKPAGMHFFYGCTGNTQDQVVDNINWAKANGGDGAIIAAPPYLCGPEDDIEAFFLEIADVTDLPDVVVGDPAVLLGRASGGVSITAADYGEWGGLSEYEVTCGMSKRVPRTYVGEAA